MLGGSLAGWEEDDAEESSAVRPSLGGVEALQKDAESKRIPLSRLKNIIASHRFDIDRFIIRFTEFAVGR
jgi:hypothetical protein